jgi:hypothetical protein
MLTFLVVLAVCALWLLRKQAFLETGKSAPLPSDSTQGHDWPKRRGWPFNELSEP